MSGFSGIILFSNNQADQLNTFIFPEKLQRCFDKKQSISADDFKLVHYNNSKFSKDIFLKQHQNKHFGFDGVNLTNTVLDDSNDLQDFVKKISTLKGTFTAVYKDNGADIFSLFSDHTGSRQLFYFINPDFFAFSSSIFLLIKIIRHFGITPTVSVSASMMMLSMGYLMDNYTVVSEIKRLTAGHYIAIEKGTFTLVRYHNYYRKTLHNHLSRDLLEEINSRFKTSIMLEYEKDREYGYNHLCTLSGGLDSRLNVMMAYKYGYKDITCVTYTEGFKHDELISRRITHDLGLKHMILLLNNGFQLYDIETPLLLNNCTVYYYGAAHTLAAVKRMNFSEYGLFHNGILAESSKGSYLSLKNHRPPVVDMYLISRKIYDRLDKKLLDGIFSKYETDEMFVTYNRGFNALHNGSWMTMPYTDSVYTYMDLDFADLAYAIHPKFRYKGFLTVEWIKKLHLEAGNYEWHRRIKPTNNIIHNLLAKITYRMELIITQKENVPVPLRDWYRQYKFLRDFIESQYQQSCSFDVLPNEIRNDVKHLFSTGSVKEKLLCLSYLKSVELLFIREV